MTADIAATQYAWCVLGNLDHPPPHDGEPDAPCWLCGCPTQGRGWQRALKLAAAEHACPLCGHIQRPAGR